MIFNVYYIRHGYSCANNVKNLESKLNHLQNATIIDPPLTDRTLADIKILMKKNKHISDNINTNFNMVCCSTMRRAQETALALFPDYKVYVLPYIKEDEIGKGNQIEEFPRNQLCGDDNKLSPNYYSNKLDYSRLNYYYSVDKNKKWLKEAHEVDYDLFVSKILKKIIEGYKNAIGEDDRLIINIAVVTHSLLMKKMFKTEKKPNNLAVGLISYDEDGKEILSRRYPPVGGNFLNDQGIGEPSSVSENDISRCKKFSYKNVSTHDDNVKYNDMIPRILLPYQDIKYSYKKDEYQEGIFY